jgi:hypothetical protein
MENVRGRHDRCAPGSTKGGREGECQPQSVRSILYKPLMAVSGTGRVHQTAARAVENPVGGHGKSIVAQHSVSLRLNSALSPFSGSSSAYTPRVLGRSERNEGSGGVRVGIAGIDSVFRLPESHPVVHLERP